MSKVVEIGTIKPLTPEEALAIAARENWTDIVILGWQGDGKFRFLNSKTSHSDLNWLLDRMKIRLHQEET